VQQDVPESYILSIRARSVPHAQTSGFAELTRTRLVLCDFAYYIENKCLDLFLWD
jgi:hypothetical protein